MLSGDTVPRTYAYGEVFVRILHWAIEDTVPDVHGELHVRGSFGIEDLLVTIITISMCVCVCVCVCACVHACVLADNNTAVLHARLLISGSVPSTVSL